MRGELRPGQRLPFNALSKRFGTSVGVLREALYRLTEQGLVESEPMTGFRVIAISQDDLAQLTEARQELETLTLRKAISDGDLAWESSVVASYHTLTRTPVHEDDSTSISRAWLEQHTRFHTVLTDGCANRHLREIAAGLRTKAELYRNWSHPAPGDGALAAKEHAALVDAVIDRDAGRAAAILATHIQRTNRALRAHDDDGRALA